MQGQRAELRRSTNTISKNNRVCRALCCSNCRTSVSSSVEGGSSRRSDRCAPISSLAHYLVQERLDQMIKESQVEQARRLMEARKRKQKSAVQNTAGSSSSSSTSSSSRRLLLVVAMEKYAHDPREDFRRSIAEVILTNKIRETKDLRYLLNCYIKMNSEEFRGIILEVFYQVQKLAVPAVEALKSSANILK